MGQEDFTKIGESYKYDKSGTLYHIVTKTDKDGTPYGEEPTKIANHTPILKEQRRIDNGTEIADVLVFSVLRNGQKGADTVVTLKDILSQQPNIKFGAACRIYLERGAKAQYAEAMQIQCENAPVTHVYQHTGYAMADGERVFLNGGYSVTKNGLTDRYNVELENGLERYGFVKGSAPERYQTLLQLLPSLAPKSVIYTGLALSFLSPLNAMLRDCGIEPRFALYFTGKTGSGKTTLAKLFLRFFGNYELKTPASFTDTINAAERKFALTDSTLLVLDDRYPTPTLSQRAKMEAMEQSVARMIGDRVGKSRANVDGSLRPTYNPKCNVIITAEESYSNVGESAIARSLSVELTPNSVNWKAMTEAQQNGDHLNQCMSEYIAYVLNEWENIESRVKPLFIEYRQKAQTGGHMRLAECVAHLQIGIAFMCEWLVAKEVITEQQGAEMQATAWAVFMELAKQQNRRITAETPVKLFLNAIREMRDRGKIRIVDLASEADYSAASTIGYHDKHFYYFYPDSIYSEVRTFYDAQGNNFPLGKTALFKQLAVDGIIETDKDQNTKIKRIKDGKRPRFLWIKATALDSEQQESD